jgi:Type IV secretory system Conjugative DNA transfer
MSQRPRKPLGSYFRKTSNAPAQPTPTPLRKPAGSYLRPAGSEAPPLSASVRPSLPYGSVILGLDTDTGQPVSVSQDDLCEGTYIEGVQGMGKTQLLEQVVYQQMQRDEALIVIDPHGDLVRSIIAHMPAHRLSKTYLLDLTDRKHPFGLNAFVCSDPTDEEKRDGTRNQIMHAFSKLWPEVLEQQYFKIYLPHIVITLIENPELTLANVERLLDDAEYRQRYTRHSKNARTREFWQHYEKLNDNQKRIQTSSLRGRLDQLLTEPVIYNILRQTKKTVNIRQLIEERAILLVKLPVNEEEYKYTAPVIGTFLMAMIYAATFSFADIPNIDDRPGFTLIVDEFQNFATDEYAKLFEQGRKYKVKQFLAHQHRQQLEREQKGRTNLAATLTAQTIIAFKTPNPTDSRELASKFTKIGDKRRPTNLHIHPLEKIKYHAHPTVKQFVLDVVDQLDAASRLRIETVKEQKSYEYPHEYFAARHLRREWRVRHYTETHKAYPQYNFGAGQVEIIPKVVAIVLEMLDKLIYHSEVQGKIDESRKETFIEAVAEYWKLTDLGREK